MAVEDEIKTAIANKKVIIGTKEVVKALKGGNVKKVIIASNVPGNTVRDLEHYQKVSGIEMEKFKGTGKQLGISCGKPFGIAVMAIRGGKK
ncbi:MAG: 50S ribosomal protein L30e [Candidatus Aenigmatarchaeota archaeon]